MTGPTSLPIGSADSRCADVLEKVAGGGSAELLWYPSCGTDYRPIMEFSDQRMHRHGFTKRPTLMIYTDAFVDPGSIGRDQILHSSARSVVRCLEAHPVSAPLFPELRSTDYHGPRSGGCACLLRVEADSIDVGRCESWVLLLGMTNCQFLLGWCGVLGIRIGTLVRVRMGLGFGSCSECLSPAYPWLRWMGVKQLLVDGEAHPINRSGRRSGRSLEADLVQNGFPMDPPAFSVRASGPIMRWSGFGVRAMKIDSAPGLIRGPEERLAAVRSVAGAVEGSSSIPGFAG